MAARNDAKARAIRNTTRAADAIVLVDERAGQMRRVQRILRSGPLMTDDVKPFVV